MRRFDPFTRERGFGGFRRPHFGNQRTWGGFGSDVDPRHQYYDRSPRDYRRSDARIREDVCDELTAAALDAGDIEVTVSAGEVTLQGTVADRGEKRLAEDLALHVRGVRDVHNRLRPVISGRALQRQLARVEEGMPVFDYDGLEIGRVTGIYLGAGDRAATAPDVNVRRASPTGWLVEAFAPPPQIPREVRDRLVREGFVRIDRGLFHVDGYAFASQIQRVGRDGVHLNARAGDVYTPLT